MSTQWLRLWHDMPTDPKWRTIARISKQRIGDVMAVYCHLMVCASNATERGRTQSFCSEDVASALDLETEQVDAILAAMQSRVLDGDHLSGWEKRQVERDDGAAARAKAWREEKKRLKTEETNATERNRTHVERKQTPDTDTDTDTDTDKTSSGDNSSAGDPASNSPPPISDPGQPGTDPITTRAVELAILLRNRGAALQPGDPNVRQWAADGVTDAQALTALEIAQQRRAEKGSSQPINSGFLLTLIAEARASPATTPGRPKRPALPTGPALTAGCKENGDGTYQF